MDRLQRNGETSKKEFIELLKPGNLLKTVSSQIPIASAGVEMLNQLQGARMDARIASIEEEMAANAQLSKEEAKANPTPQLPQDWPVAVSEYLHRTVDIAVFYGAEHRTPAKRGHELFKLVGHGAIVAENEVITSGGVLELAQGVADHLNGRIALLVGLARYTFVADPVEKMSGLVLLHLGSKDDDDYQRYKAALEKRGIGDLLIDPPKNPASYSLTPWMGQEVGFIYNGEAEDALNISHFSNRQFDTCVISHFLKSREDRIKAFVSGVLSGRVRYAGSPVFSRNGEILGIVSDTKRYPSDTGIRLEVRSLLGHPKFMKAER